MKSNRFFLLSVLLCFSYSLFAQADYTLRLKSGFITLQPNIKTRHPSPDESSHVRKERLWGDRQGESLATALNLLVFRQSLDRETGDGQSRQTHAGSGWSHLENSDGETQGHRQVSAARLSTATAAMGPHSNNETN
mgnify:CR=1 FL=1